MILLEDQRKFLFDDWMKRVMGYMQAFVNKKSNQQQNDIYLPYKRS